MRLAGHAARAGAGQSRRTPARAPRLAADAGPAPRAGRNEPGVLAPTSQMRTFRELEPPSPDEGFAAVEHVPFVRAASPPEVSAFSWRPAPLRAGLGGRDRPGRPGGTAPGLRLGPGRRGAVLTAGAKRLAASVPGPVETALCPHPAGPPACWCRPPLPGLALVFAREHGIDLSRSILIGTGPAHRTLATTLGSRYVGVQSARFPRRSTSALAPRLAAPDRPPLCSRPVRSG